MRLFKTLVLFAVSVFCIQLETVCPSDSYFDTTLLACQTCPETQVQSSDGYSCQCAAGYSKTETDSSSTLACQSCGTGAPTQDFSQCQTCPTGYNAELEECSCDPDNFEVVIERADDGSYLTTKRCQSCGSLNYYPGPTAHECKVCPDPGMIRESTTYECVCDPNGYKQSGDTCVSTSEAEGIESIYPLETARNVIYYEHESSGSIGTYALSASSTFTYYYLQAARNCSNYNSDSSTEDDSDYNYDYDSIRGCQVLANLCVLQLYSEESTVCKLYQNLMQSRTIVENPASDSGWRENMPWIYYQNNAEDVLDSKRVQLEVTFDPSGDGDMINELKFYLAKYAMNGEFLGYDKLTDQLILCPHSSEDTKRYRKFGTNMIYNCELDLEPYLSYSETVFYDLYLVDNGDALLEVPILIKNFKDTSGDNPNESSSRSDWRLVRRFYIYDNISGKEGNDAYESGAKTTVLSYLRETKLQITLMEDEDQRIYIPILYLTYRSRTSVYIEEDSSDDSISFTSEYTMDSATFMEVALGVLIANNILTVLIWLVRVYIWMKNNPSVHSRDTYTIWVIGKASLIFIGTWSFMFFWYLFVFTAYWFIFYKMQYHVYILLPSLDEYKTNYGGFEIVLGLVIASQLVDVLNIIRNQCKVDYFFIDWETPNRVIKSGADPIKAIVDQFKYDNEVQMNDLQRSGVTNWQREAMERSLAQNQAPAPFSLVQQGSYKLSVSAWRSLFVANELNELQAKRYISIEFTLLFLLFFLHGLGWDQLGAAQPNMDVDVSQGTNSPTNPVLRFFITTFLFLVIGYSQLIIRKLISTWIPTAVQNFTDLCSVANISILILDQSLHGFYIHGESPTGSADGTIEELIKSLAQEASGKARSRGILPEDESGLQCFEIYIPFQMRKTYDNMATNPVDEEINSYNSNRRDGQASKILLYSPALPKEIDYDRLENIRKELNKRLKTYIATTIMEAKSHILEKSPLQRFLNMPPTNMAILEGSPFFYKDPGMNFERVFLMGKEFNLLLMDLLVFALIDYTAKNTFLAAFITYLWSKFGVWIRSKLGELNLSRKILVDKRFLI